ncbi:peptidase [Streptomyces sp. NPDC002676]
MAAAVAVLAGSITHTPTATADSSTDSGYVGFRLLEAPVERQDDPRALQYIVDHLKPGTVIERRFEVDNQTDTARQVQLYPGAAWIKHNRFVFADGGRPNELTRWIHVRPALVRLKPREKTEARVTIRVPGTAGPGERYAVVWAQSEVPPDATHNVGSIMRVGTRVYLDISNSGEYADFRISKIVALRDKKGVPSVVAHVHNTGKRALDLRGKLSLSDGPNRLSAGSLPVTEGTTLPPGGRGTVRVDGLDKSLPAGPWTAHMELESGMVSHSFSVRLTFPEPGGSSDVKIVASSHRKIWAAGSGIMLTVSTATTMSFVRYRRRRAAGNRK